MKRWLSALLALLMLCACFTVQAENRRTVYTGGVVLRTFPKWNEAPGDAYINVGFVECSMPYLLLGQTTSWQLGIEGGQAPYNIEVTLWRRPFDATDEYYWWHDAISLADKLSFNYVFRDAGDYFWEIAVTDRSGQTLVFQTRPMKTAEADEEANARTAVGKVNQIIAEEITAGMSEYQRALVLHDWLIYHANYDYTYTWYEPEGVLLHGTGVCDSYARAYQMLCTAAGLECIYVSGRAGGGTHGWNLVKIDGKWYHVDCTWDDPGEGGYEYHKYFLLTDEEMGRDHTWNIPGKGDMMVPDAEDSEFEGSVATDADFTFATLADCAAAIRAMKAAGNYRRNVVGLYTGNQDINAVYEAFGQWAHNELAGVLGSDGWWSRWSASGNRFLLTIEWNTPVEYARFDEEKVILSAGEEKKIAASDYYPAADVFTWVSSDPAVATVSAAYDGKSGLTMNLTGVSGGTAVITVTSRDGVSDSMEVTVMPGFTPDMHVEEEISAEGIHLTWPGVPGVTEYHVHIMIAGQEQEECMAVVTDHEAYLTNAQLPANVKHEVWIVGRRVIGGQVVAEYCGEHKHHDEHSVQVAHTPVKDAGVAPTCTATGLTEGSHCVVCGTVITAQEIIPALGHDEFVDWGLEPSCTQTGLSQGSHCSRCDAVITAQEIIPALGHDELVDWGLEPTCTQTGLSQGSHCIRCDAVIIAQEVIPALGHAEVIDEAVAATCTSTGLTEGSHCSRCGTILRAQEAVPMKAHMAVIDPAVPRGEVTTGLTEGKHCAVCGKILVAQQVIPAIFEASDGALIAYHGAAKTVVIPSEIGGKPVKSIGSRAFADCAAMKSLTIPASVNSIAADAFRGCSNDLVLRVCAQSYAHNWCKERGLTYELVDGVRPEIIVPEGTVPARTGLSLAEIGVNPAEIKALFRPTMKVSLVNGLLMVEDLGAEEVIYDGSSASYPMTLQEDVCVASVGNDANGGRFWACANGVWTATYVWSAGDAQAVWTSGTVHENGATLQFEPDGTISIFYTSEEGCSIEDHYTATGALRVETVSCTIQDVFMWVQYDSAGKMLMFEGDFGGDWYSYMPETGWTLSGPPCSAPPGFEMIDVAWIYEHLPPRMNLKACFHACVIIDAAAEPTCTADGVTEGKRCAVCGTVIVAQEVIPALGHDELIVKGVSPKQGSSGLTDLIVCKRCGVMLQRQETIPALTAAAFTVPGMIKEIEAEAFMGCRFEAAVIGEGCQRIGAFAFAGNAALRLVEIPASVTAIDATAFAGCSEALVIVTEAGSAADAFARMNGLPLVSR